MKSLLVKTAVGAVAVASLLVAGPGNFAQGAPGDGTGIRRCVQLNRAAGQKATNQFKRALRQARQLPDDQQQAAVEAARAAFSAAAGAARTSFASCVDAAQGD